jgi:hypothetical protein
VAETVERAPVMFGVWGAVGHRYYTAAGHHPSYTMLREQGLPLTPDGTYAPGTNTVSHRRSMQKQSRALLTHVAYWTILGMWDRTGDTRYASSTTFFLPTPSLSFVDACADAEAAFPAVWLRINSAEPVAQV